MDGLTPEQVSQYREAFKMFADNGESITKDSLTNCMKQVGFRPTAADVNKMFDEAVDGASKISFSEFLTMISEKKNSMDSANTLIDAFESYDSQITGYISHDEFKRICALGGKNKFSDAEVRGFIKMGEAGEGKFDYSAFSKKITSE